MNEPLIGHCLSPFLADQFGWRLEAVDEDDLSIRRVQRDLPAQFFAAEFAYTWSPLFGRLICARVSSRRTLSIRGSAVAEPG